MTNPDLTALCLVVDRSGSMQPIAKDMNGGIRTLMQEQWEQPGKVMIDVFTFDNTTEHVVKNVPLDDTSHPDYVVPRGSTALNDAIGLAVTTLGERFADMPEDERPATVVVVIVTDGQENASQEWTTDRVRALVTQQTDEYGWTFLYLAANVDAFATGAAFGIQATHSMAYTASGAGAQGMSAGASAAVTRTRGGTFKGYTDEERKAAEA
jgi:uncharacterized protein YegL